VPIDVATPLRPRAAAAPEEKVRGKSLGEDEQRELYLSDIDLVVADLAIALNRIQADNLPMDQGTTQKVVIIESILETGFEEEPELKEQSIRLIERIKVEQVKAINNAIVRIEDILKKIEGGRGFNEMTAEDEEFIYQTTEAYGILEAQAEEIQNILSSFVDPIAERAFKVNQDLYSLRDGLRKGVSFERQLLEKYKRPIKPSRYLARIKKEYALGKASSTWRALRKVTAMRGRNALTLRDEIAEIQSFLKDPNFILKDSDRDFLRAISQNYENSDLGKQAAKILADYDNRKGQNRDFISARAAEVEAFLTRQPNLQLFESMQFTDSSSVLIQLGENSYLEISANHITPVTMRINEEGKSVPQYINSKGEPVTDRAEGQIALTDKSITVGRGEENGIQFPNDRTVHRAPHLEITPMQFTNGRKGVQVEYKGPEDGNGYFLKQYEHESENESAYGLDNNLMQNTPELAELIAIGQRAILYQEPLSDEERQIVEGMRSKYILNDLFVPRIEEILKADERLRKEIIGRLVGISSEVQKEPLDGLKGDIAFAERMASDFYPAEIREYSKERVLEFVSQRIAVDTIRASFELRGRFGLLEGGQSLSDGVRQWASDVGLGTPTFSSENEEKLRKAIEIAEKNNLLVLRTLRQLESKILGEVIPFVPPEARQVAVAAAPETVKTPRRLAPVAAKSLGLDKALEVFLINNLDIPVTEIQALGPLDEQEIANFLDANRDNIEVIKVRLDAAFERAVRQLDQAQVAEFVENVVKGDLRQSIPELTQEIDALMEEQFGLDDVLSEEAVSEIQDVLLGSRPATQAVDQFTELSGLQAMMLEYPEVTGMVLNQWEKDLGLFEKVTRQDFEIHATITTTQITPKRLQAMIGVVGGENFTATFLLSKEEKQSPEFQELRKFIADYNKIYPGSIKIGRTAAERNKANIAARDVDSILYDEAGHVVVAGDGQLAADISQKAVAKNLPIAYVPTGVNELDSTILQVVARAAGIDSVTGATKYIQEKLGDMVQIKTVNGQNVIIPIVTRILEKFQNDMKAAVAQAIAA